MVPNAGCGNRIRIRDAEWVPNAVYVDARFLPKIQGAHTLPNNSHTVLTVDTGYGYGIRDTEFVPNAGYGIRIRDTGCKLAPKCRIESRYRIQMQDTEHRMGPNQTDTGYGYGIRDTEFAPLRPLLLVQDTDTEYEMQSWPHTHTINKMQDTDARYGIQSLPHTFA